MIQILLTARNNIFSSLEVSGHQELDTNSSVCNSVSVLTQTFEECLLQLVTQNNIRILNRHGYSFFEILDASLDQETMKNINCFLKFYLTGIKRIEIAYPAELKIEFLR